jgi:4-amino-4-deoxy-L-arabinose transferase-like glycosyltransferase
LFFGKLLDVIFSLLSVYLVYRLAEELYGKRAALFAGLLFSLNPVFIIFTGLVLTEPLALFLGLSGMWLFFRRKESEPSCSHPSYLYLYLGGFLFGLSFLTKFPQGMLFGVALLIIIFHPGYFSLTTLLYPKLKTKLFAAIWLSLGFFTVVLPYLILNHYLYNNWWWPFAAGTSIMSTATWLYGTSWSYYLTEFFLRNWIYLLFFPLLWWFWKQKEWKDYRKSTLLLLSLLFLAYFLYLPRKEVRYLVLVLPYLCLLLGGFMDYLYNRLTSISLPSLKPILKPYAFFILFALLLLLPLPTSLNLERPPTFEKEISQIIREENITGSILTSDPSFVSFLDLPVVTLDGMEFSTVIYQQQRSHYQLLFLNDCDLACPPLYDSRGKECLEQKKMLLGQMWKDNNIKFSMGFKNCTYSILLPK